MTVDQDIPSVFPPRYRQMVADKAKSPEDVLTHLRPHPIEAHQFHMAYALADEVYELEMAWKVWDRVSYTPENGMAVIKELGDYAFYLCGLTGGRVRGDWYDGDGQLAYESTELVLAHWPKGLSFPENAGKISADFLSGLEWLKFLTHLLQDAWKRILIYRTGDPQVSEVSAENAAKRKRLEILIKAASMLAAQTIGDLAALVDPVYTFEMVLELHIEKLDARYGKSYSHAAASDRKDVADGQDDCTAADPATQA